MKLNHSFPKLNSKSLEIVAQKMKELFDYPSLPQDYKDFLLTNNGGYVSPGYIDDVDTENDFIEHTEEVVFETPLKWAKMNNKPVTPCIVHFFVVWVASEMKEEDVTDWEIYDLIKSNEHSKLDFDILPEKMMSIAKCSHPDAADMLCISLDKSDFGAVYYTYDRWYFPNKFHGDYYEQKEQAILNKYQLKSAEYVDLSTTLGKQAQFELDRIPFVKVADSFKEFLENLRIQKINH